MISVHTKVPTSWRLDDLFPNIWAFRADGSPPFAVGGTASHQWEISSPTVWVDPAYLGYSHVRLVNLWVSPCWIFVSSTGLLRLSWFIKYVYLYIYTHNIHGYSLVKTNSPLQCLRTCHRGSYNLCTFSQQLPTFARSCARFTRPLIAFVSSCCGMDGSRWGS